MRKFISKIVVILLVVIAVLFSKYYKVLFSFKIFKLCSEIFSGI